MSAIFNRECAPGALLLRKPWDGNNSSISVVNKVILTKLASDHLWWSQPKSWQYHFTAWIHSVLLLAATDNDSWGQFWFSFFFCIEHNSVCLGQKNFWTVTVTRLSHHRNQHTSTYPQMGSGAPILQRIVEGRVVAFLRSTYLDLHPVTQ